MTERIDLETFWEESPRLIEVASPSVDITMQDLHDTMRSNTEQAGEGDLDNLDDDFIIDSAGKEDLGGGVLVGITSTLQNAQLMFESRLTPTEEGTITNGDASGIAFEDSTALLITNNVNRGAVLINFTDESITEILEVLTETTARTRVLRAGTLNQYTFGDVYKIWNIVQCDVEGGNLVAIDDIDAVISSIFPTAFTQIVRTSSSSATLQEQEDIEYASFESGVTIDQDNGVSGVTFPIGTPREPVDNFTDLLTIANSRGFTRIYLKGMTQYTLPTGLDFTNFRFVGESPFRTLLDVPAAATVTNCEYTRVLLTGTMDGDVMISLCGISTLTMSQGIIDRCGLLEVTITLTGSQLIRFIDCWDDTAGISEPTIDMGGSGPSLIMRNYSGGIKLTNKSGAEQVSLSVDSGRVVVDDTVTNGEIVIRGVGKWDNKATYTGGADVIDETVDGIELTEMWKLLGLDAGDKITINPGGITTEDGSFTITFTGDGVSETIMERTA